MSYQLRASNGSLVIDLVDGTIDQTKTSLTLVGKNVSDFGKDQNENFIHLLENFSNESAPPHSIKGQLWFNSYSEELLVKTTTGFKSIGPFDAPTTPSITDSGDGLATTAFVHQILPKGSIIMWYGSTDNIPTGWALCDGRVISQSGGRPNLVTPNLVNRFVLAAGEEGPETHTIGGAAGITSVPSHKHTWGGTTGANSADHTHTGVTNTQGTHKHLFPGDDQLSFANGVAGWAANSAGGFGYDARSVGGGGGQLWETTSAGSHNHTLNIGNQSNSHTHDVSGETSTVGTASVSVLNPYYTLAYIMKVV